MSDQKKTKSTDKKLSENMETSTIKETPAKASAKDAGLEEGEENVSISSKVVLEKSIPLAKFPGETIAFKEALCAEAVAGLIKDKSVTVSIKKDPKKGVIIAKVLLNV